MLDALPEPLYALFRGRDPYLRVDTSFIGNRPRDGAMLLGCESSSEDGPGESADLGILLHEMGHLIEIDDDRCHMLGWGLWVRRIAILGQPCHEPLTFQATEREMRVCAIQKKLADHAGVPFDVMHWMDLFMKYQPDWYCFHVRYPDVDRKATDDEKARIMGEDTLKQSEELSLDDILSEWDRKASILKQRSAEGLLD